MLGLSNVPRAGDTFLVAPDERTARQIAEKREAADRNAAWPRPASAISLEDFDQAVADGKIETLNLILKGDVSGSVEALEDALLKIDVGDEVELRVIHRGVGAITQNDVNLARRPTPSSSASTCKPKGGTPSWPTAKASTCASTRSSTQRSRRSRRLSRACSSRSTKRSELGTAEVREVFRSSKFGNIAGSIVRSGEIKRGAKARITRQGVVVAEGIEVAGLRRFKDDVTEVRDGFECGINLGSYNDLQLEDLITTYEMREKPRA